MAEKKLNVRIQLKRGTKEEWAAGTAPNFVPKNGEPIIISNGVKNGVPLLKVGDANKTKISALKTVGCEWDNILGKTVATTTAAGLMSAADKVKLNGVAAGATNYSHPTGAGYKHIPAGGASKQILKWVADGTAAWSDNIADKADKLTTPRTINGVAFDGTSNIHINANPLSNGLSNQDLNEVTTVGFYYAGGGNAVTNKPAGVDAFGLLVYKNAGGYTAQELTSSNTVPALKKYIRQYTGSTWSNWIEMKYTNSVTHLYASDGTAANKTTTNGNTKLTVADDTTVRGSVTIKGSGRTTVTSDASGNIIINSTGDGNNAHHHAAGVGLALAADGSSGGTSGTVKYKAKLKSEANLTNSATVTTEVADRVYSVGVDKDGYLAVNVPWLITGDAATIASKEEVQTIVNRVLN